MTRRPIRSGTLLALLGVLAAWLPTGCASPPWRKVALDAASGFYADAELTYRLDAGKLGQPLDVVCVEGQRVSHEQVPSSPLAGESIGTLQVIYPHPSGRAGLALARFTLDSVRPKPAAPKPWNPFAKTTGSVEAPSTMDRAHPEIHECWELDIDGGESNQIFKMLTDMGFYQSERPGTPARVTVKMQGNQQTKDWDQIAALNLLIQRVRTQGRLVAFSRPRAAAGSVSPSIASTDAFRQLMAARGAPASNPLAASNAFSLVRPMPSGPTLPVGPFQGPAGHPASIARQGSPGTAVR